MLCTMHNASCNAPCNALCNALYQALERQLKRSGAVLDAAGRRAMHWHLANLEFACAADLNSVSAEHWDQVRHAYT